MYYNGIQTYRKTNVITSDPMRLIIMCYEEAIESLKRAKQNIKGKNYEEKGKSIEKAQNIIEELISSLDFEKGNKIANNLESLYNYMIRRIVEGDLRKDIRAIDEVIGMLSDLLTAWKEVASKPSSQTQPTERSIYQEKRSAGQFA